MSGQGFLSFLDSIDRKLNAGLACHVLVHSEMMLVPIMPKKIVRDGCHLKELAGIVICLPEICKSSLGGLKSLLESTLIRAVLDSFPLLSASSRA